MHEDQVYINQALQNGAMAYVFKSSDDTELLNALQSVANNKSYIDQNIKISKNDINKLPTPNITSNLRGYTNLSKREREVLPLVTLGYSNKEIAADLFISTKTVEAHKANIMRKLKLHSRVDLIRYAVHHNLVDL